MGKIGSLRFVSGLVALCVSSGAVLGGEAFGGAFGGDRVGNVGMVGDLCPSAEFTKTDLGDETHLTWHGSNWVLEFPATGALSARDRCTLAIGVQASPGKRVSIEVAKNSFEYLRESGTTIGAHSELFWVGQQGQPEDTEIADADHFGVIELGTTHRALVTDCGGSGMARLNQSLLLNRTSAHLHAQPYASVMRPVSHALDS